jgi:hypothetical protein
MKELSEYTHLAATDSSQAHEREHDSSNAKLSPRYFKFRTSGMAYVKRVLDTDWEGEPRLTCELVALRGHSLKIEYTFLQLLVLPELPRLLLTSCRSARDEQRTLLIGFVAEDCYPARQTASANPEACAVRGRLTHIKWIRVDGHVIYKYKHDGVSDDKQSHSYRGLTELLFVEAALCAALDDAELTVDDVRTAFQRSLERVLTRQPGGLAGVMLGQWRQ